jgi:hypothetical protein
MSVDIWQSPTYAKSVEKRLVLATAAFCLLGGAARADGYERAAQVLAKYAMELIPSKRGMVEAGLSAVAYEWLKDHVWAAETTPPDHSPPPIRKPPVGDPDFGTAWHRACSDRSLDRDAASFLGCPGQPLALIKPGEIHIEFDLCSSMTPVQCSIIKTIKSCEDAPLKNMPVCMGYLQSPHNPVGHK